MDRLQLLANLEDVVQQLGIEVQAVRGDAPSGLCRLGGKRVLMRNQALTDGQLVTLLVRELARVDLSAVFILPAVRKMIEAGRPEARNSRPTTP